MGSSPPLHAPLPEVSTPSVDATDVTPPSHLWLLKYWEPFDVRDCIGDHPVTKVATSFQRGIKPGEFTKVPPHHANRLTWMDTAPPIFPSAPHSGADAPFPGTLPRHQRALLDPWITSVFNAAPGYLGVSDAPPPPGSHTEPAWAAPIGPGGVPLRDAVTHATRHHNGTNAVYWCDGSSDDDSGGDSDGDEDDFPPDDEYWDEDALLVADEPRNPWARAFRREIKLARTHNPLAGSRPRHLQAPRPWGLPHATNAHPSGAGRDDTPRTTVPEVEDRPLQGPGEAPLIICSEFLESGLGPGWSPAPATSSDTTVSSKPAPKADANVAWGSGLWQHRTLDNWLARVLPPPDGT